MTTANDQASIHGRPVTTGITIAPLFDLVLNRGNRRFQRFP
jgi:hypothetical protein